MPNEILKQKILKQTLTEPRDNTRTRFITNYTPLKSLRNEEFYKNLRRSEENFRLDDGPLGFIPIVGDILSAAQAIRDFNDKKYLEAAGTAGMLLLPNFIEKTIKPFVKPAFSKIILKKIKPTVNIAAPVVEKLIEESTTDSDSEGY